MQPLHAFVYVKSVVTKRVWASEKMKISVMRLFFSALMSDQLSLLALSLLGSSLYTVASLNNLSLQTIRVPDTGVGAAFLRYNEKNKTRGRASTVTALSAGGRFALPFSPDLPAYGVGTPFLSFSAVPTSPFRPLILLSPPQACYS